LLTSRKTLAGSGDHLRMHTPVAAVPGVAHLVPSVAPLAHSNEIRASSSAQRTVSVPVRTRRAGPGSAFGPGGPAGPGGPCAPGGPAGPCGPCAPGGHPLPRRVPLGLVDPLCRPDRLDLVDLVCPADPLDLADPLCRPDPLDLADPMRVGRIPRQRAPP
jgi:hypothetical protein